MTDLFPSFFADRKSPTPSAASAASAARELHEDDLQRMQQVQQPAKAEIGYGGLPSAADAASAAGWERGNQAHPKAATASASDALAWQARAVSLEHDAGLPREWAEPFARLLCGGPPGDYEQGYWGRTLSGAAIFASQWAGAAHRAGWSLESVFGLDDIAPARRHDRKGLAWLLPDGKRVIALDEQGADIETDRGVKQRFYRRNETISDTIKDDAKNATRSLKS